MYRITILIGENCILKPKKPCCLRCPSTVFSSPELKAQVSFSDHLLSSACKLFTYLSSSPEPLHGSISTKLGTKHPWMKGIKVCSIEGPCPFPRWDNNKNTLKKLKNLLLQKYP